MLSHLLLNFNVKFLLFFILKVLTFNVLPSILAGWGTLTKLRNRCLAKSSGVDTSRKMSMNILKPAKSISCQKGKMQHYTCLLPVLFQGYLNCCKLLFAFQLAISGKMNMVFIFLMKIILTILLFSYFSQNHVVKVVYHQAIPIHICETFP